MKQFQQEIRKDLNQVQQEMCRRIDDLGKDLRRQDQQTTSMFGKMEQSMRRNRQEEESKLQHLNNNQQSTNQMLQRLLHNHVTSSANQVQDYQMKQVHQQVAKEVTQKCIPSINHAFENSLNNIVGLVQKKLNSGEQNIQQFICNHVQSKEMNDKLGQIFGGQILQYVNRVLPQMLQQSVQIPVEGAVEEMYQKFSEIFTEGYNATVSELTGEIMTKVLSPPLNKIDSKLAEVGSSISSLHRSHEDTRNYIKQCVNEAVRQIIPELKQQLLVNIEAPNNQQNDDLSQIKSNLNNGHVDRAVSIALNA